MLSQVAVRLVAWRIAEGKREAAAAAKAGAASGQDGGRGRGGGTGKGAGGGQPTVERHWRGAKLNGKSHNFSPSWNVQIGRAHV